MNLLEIIFSVSLGVEAEPTPLKSFIDFLRNIPEDAWVIIKITIGFWFGGCVAAYLIDRWKVSQTENIDYEE